LIRSLSDKRLFPDRQKLFFLAQNSCTSTGLPDGLFSNQKIPIWVGTFWRALVYEMRIYFMAVWNILRTFGIFYDNLVHFVLIWYIFSGFGIIVP
jgi:hypothetical protein